MKFDYKDAAEAFTAATVEGARIIELMKLCEQHLPPQIAHDLTVLLKDLLGEAANLSKQVDVLTEVTKTLAVRMAKQAVDGERLDALGEFGAHSIHFIGRDRLALEPGQTLRAGCDILRRELKAQQGGD
jgi:hypothetical protein